MHSLESFQLQLRAAPLLTALLIPTLISATGDSGDPTSPRPAPDLRAAAPLPCTTFVLRSGDRVVFGRNYDWRVGSGLVIVNKKGLAKTALVKGTDAPARWVSRYGSVSFNQYGRELPMGGLNEVGLVIEQMMLSGSVYPAADDRPALRELAWIQYQLDTAGSVEDVIASDAELRILSNGVPLHFLVCDRSGDAATIEFLGGKMVVHRGDSLPIAVLANSPYSQSMRHLEGFEGFGGEQPLPRSTKSLDRFARAADGIRSYDGKADGTGQSDEHGKDIIQHAFSILKDVSQGPGTQWSIVYDLEEMSVHFRTAESTAIKVLALSSCDFSPTTPCRVVDIHTEKPGDVQSRLLDYTTEINRKQIFHAWKNTEFLKNTPEAVLNMWAEYPETIRVAEKELAGH